MIKPVKQNERFGMRLNTKDLERLQELINHYGSNGSEVVRQLIKKEYNTLVDKAQTSKK